jgi:membrane protein YdbS with pleckstrin-like domain
MRTPNIVASPSQIQNFGWLIFSIGGLLIHPIFGGLFFLMLIYSIIDVTCWKYEFHDEFMVERRGVFSVDEEMVQYFRIKSIKVERPLWMRFFGLSTIHVTTSEQHKPTIKFYAVEHAEIYVDMLQQLAKLERKKNGIRDMDIFYS